jgi:hypothetical protein
MMPWVRLDEAFPEHPKVVAIGGDAGWLLVCAIAYCNRNLTDGFVPETILARLSDRRRPHQLAARLVSAGLFEVADGGWRIHDFLDYQSSRAKVEEDRAKARERMARNRNGSTSVRPNNSVRSPYPTRPDLSTKRQTDDLRDVRPNTNGLSSSVEDLLKVTAHALGLKDRANPAARFIAGIERNLRAERLDEITDVAGQELDLEAAVTQLVGDPVYARMAIEARS